MGHQAGDFSWVLPPSIGYFSASEMSQFMPDSIILNVGLLGSCSQVSSLAPRKKAREVIMGREREKKKEKVESWQVNIEHTRLSRVISI